jgi:hypothetical protein
MLIIFPVDGNNCQVTILNKASVSARFAYFKQTVAISATIIP